MKAVIVTGGKQYTVAEGDVIYVEKLGVEAENTVTFDQVLAVVDGENSKFGTPIGVRRYRRRQGDQEWQRQEDHRLQIPPQEGFQVHSGPPSALHQGGDHQDCPVSHDKSGIFHPGRQNHRIQLLRARRLWGGRNGHCLRRCLRCSRSYRVYRQRCVRRSG